MERSYTALTRAELVKVKPANDAQTLAELASFAYSSGNMRLGRGKLALELFSESEEIILRMTSFLKRLYDGTPEMRAVERTQPKKHTEFLTEIAPGTPEGKLLFDMGLLSGTASDYVFGNLKSDAFEKELSASLRGAFLASGVMCDPKKSYRVEFVISNEEFASFLLNALETGGFSAKMLRRNDRNVIYINQIDSVSDILISIGASNVMLEVENVRVSKEVKNRLNRSGNCIFGNIGKTVTASQRQLTEIEALAQAKVKLSDTLTEACDLRTAHPESSLSELAEISGVSKSALNKRFIKIHELFTEICGK